MITGFEPSNKPEVIPLYNGDIILQYSDAGHRYQVVHKGEKILGTVGVTTIIGILDKPYLLQWAVNESVEVFRKTLLTQSAPLDEISLGTLCAEASLSWRRKRDTAGDIGTLIHKWIEQYINWKLGKCERPAIPVAKQIQDATMKFLLWEKENHVKFLTSEQKLYSKKHNYAGTCDFTYVRDGVLGVGDIKSSKYIYDTFSLQLAAYRYALEEERTVTITNASKIPFSEMTVVRVGKDDGALETKRFYNYEGAIKSFLACLLIYRYMRANTVK